uniref:Cytochrome P450 n=1 Tax=Physcomitrium patens TaxID=3218 RepID=A0A7I4B718_PHYPA
MYVTLLNRGSAIAVVAIFLLARFITTPKNIPPGPFAWPIIGSLHLIGPYPHRSLAKLAEKYGSLMSVWFGQRLIIFATSPETALEFVKTQDANFCSRPKQQAPSVLLPHDLTFSDVTSHSKLLRKIFQQQFTTSKKMEATQQLRANEFAHMLRTIPHDTTVNVKFHLEVLAGNIFSQLVMSRRLLQPSSIEDTTTDSTEKLKDLMKITADLDRIIGTFNPGDFIPAVKRFDLAGIGCKFKQFRNRMDSFVEKIIQERLEERKSSRAPKELREKDYLDALLDEADQQKEIDLNVVKTMIWEIFAAGMETNIASSEWAMAELVNAPHTMKKAQAELDAVVGRDRMVKESDLPNLPYIKAIAKESLRLHPPVPFLAHQCIKSCKAFGYDIKSGTSVFVNVYGLGRLESIYPDPNTFNPDRFLPGGSNVGLDYQGQNFELLPFGSGRRICAGMPVASLMVQTAVATLLHAFTWIAPKDHELMEGLGAASLSKAVPLKAHATPRLPSHVYSL